MNELKALKTFLLAAEKRNFAQVARELDMTPASVTRTIAALEEELGVQLFVRTTRQVSLTTDGAVFAARIEPAVNALETARLELMNVHKADQGRLRINAPMSLGQQVLPQILSAFRDVYPKIEIELSLTDQMLDIVEQDFDLAIRISGAPSDKFTIWRKIIEIKRILVAAPGTPFIDVAHPGELTSDGCLGYSSESRRENWALSDGSSTVNVSAGRMISANNGEVLANMAADGAGSPCCLCSSWLNICARGVSCISCRNGRRRNFGLRFIIRHSRSCRRVLRLSQISLSARSRQLLPG